MSRLFWQCAGHWDAAIAERVAQCAVLLAEEVCQLSVKQRNRQTEQNTAKLHEHA